MERANLSGNVAKTAQFPWDYIKPGHYALHACRFCLGAHEEIPLPWAGPEVTNGSCDLCGRGERAYRIPEPDKPRRR